MCQSQLSQIQFRDKLSIRLYIGDNARDQIQRQRHDGGALPAHVMMRLSGDAGFEHVAVDSHDGLHRRTRPRNIDRGLVEI